jgi:outer membrane protein OmpA-like peptidoglycan-associated protein
MPLSRRRVLGSVVWHAQLCALAVSLAIVPSARANPVELSLTNVVPAGKKPSISVKASEAVTLVQLDIERLDDKKAFHYKLGPLKPGDRTELGVGDGKPGRARWKGKMTIRAASGESSLEVTFESNAGAAGPALKVGYDRSHLDLEHGRLQFTVSRPAVTAHLSVVGDDGQELATTDQPIADKKPGQWIAIDWKTTAQPVLRLELTVRTDGGDAVIARLVPWSVSIPHEEVVFPSGESAVPPSEEKKLDVSYQKIVDAVDKVRRHEPGLDVRVYIAGHTDTVGGSDDNRKLSQARARSIAKWFRDRGLPLPMFFAGFGEDQLKVKTGDNADEAKNRRADYVVGVEEPVSGRGRYAPLK